jgi:hypothetical protein
MIDWHQLVYDTLIDYTDLTDIVPTNRIKNFVTVIPNQGELPDLPFIIIRLGLKTFALGDACFQQCSIYMHDKPVGYKRINLAMGKIKEAMSLIDLSQTDMIAAIWQGNSGEIADEGFNTIYRTAEYRLVGRGE